MKTLDYEFKTAAICPGSHFNCVSVKRTATDVQVKDTKRPDDAPLVFDHDEWSTFLEGIRNNEFDV